VSFAIGNQTIRLPANLLTNSPSTPRTALLNDDASALNAAVGVVQKGACVGSFDLLLGAIIYGNVDRLEVQGLVSGQQKHLDDHYPDPTSHASTSFDLFQLLQAMFLTEKIQTPCARSKLCEEVSDDLKSVVLTKDQLVKVADEITVFKRRFSEACRSLTDFFVSWTISYGIHQLKTPEVLDLHDASVRDAMVSKNYRTIVQQALATETTSDDKEEKRIKQLIADCLDARPRERTRKKQFDYRRAEEPKRGAGETRPPTTTQTASDNTGSARQAIGSNGFSDVLSGNAVSFPSNTASVHATPAEDGVAAENTAGPNDVPVAKKAAKISKRALITAVAASTSALNPAPSTLPTIDSASAQNGATGPTRRSVRLANQDLGRPAWAPLMPKRKQAPDAQSEGQAENGPVKATKKQAAPPRKRQKVTPKTNTKAAAPVKNAGSTTEPSTAHVGPGQTGVKSIGTPEGVKSGVPFSPGHPAAPVAEAKVKAKPKPKGKAQGKPAKANAPVLAAKDPSKEHILRFANATTTQEGADDAQSAVVANPKDDDANDDDDDASDDNDPHLAIGTGLGRGKSVPPSRKRGEWLASQAAAAEQGKQTRRAREAEQKKQEIFAAMDKQREMDRNDGT
jgi:hypothetical protein